MNNLSEFDASRFYLGRLCKHGHDWNGTGQSLRRLPSTYADCVDCHLERSKKQSRTTKHKEWCKEWQRNRRQLNRYLKWLSNPVVSPTVAELVAREQRRYDKSNRYQRDPEYREKRRIWFKQRYQQNIEHERMRVRIYRHSNPDKVAKWGDRRKQLAATQADGSLTANVVRSLFQKTKSCIYCGINFPDSKPTLDHIIPLSRGGAHAVWNVVVCCEPCNLAKRNLPFDEWLTRIDEPYRTASERMYRERYGQPPTEGVLPLVFV